MKNKREFENRTVGNWDHGEECKEQLNRMIRKVLLLKGYLSPQSVICRKWLRPRPRRWPGSPHERPAAAGPGLGCPYQLSPARAKQM